MVKPVDYVLTIPLDMIDIPVGAFSTCVDLKVVIIHANVKSIRHEAFYSTDVEVVKFEEASLLKFIDRDAFRETHSLRSINIPSGVIIEPYAFHGTDCGDDMFTRGATIVDCIVINTARFKRTSKKEKRRLILLVLLK